MFKTLERWWNEEEELHPEKPELTLAVTKLMLGMMAMDGVMRLEQKAEIMRLLNERFGLSADESEALMQRAGEADHRFEVLVEQLNSTFELEEKTTILKELWQVAIVDGEVDFREERLLNRLSSLLGVPADSLGDIKLSGADLQHTHPTFTG